MEYTYKALSHLSPKDFGIVASGNDIVRGHCMWGGSDMPTHDWCGVKVHNEAATGRVQRVENGCIDGRLYGFAVYRGMDDGKELAPESQSYPFWVCKNHDAEFMDLHKDWGHTMVTFAVPNGAVYEVIEKPKPAMYEVSFRFYTDNLETDTNHVSMRWTDVLNGVLEDTESVQYLKVVGT